MQKTIVRFAVALLALITVGPLSASPAEHAAERGFKPELAYDFNGFDTVNMSNGNLLASIPLGPTFPVSDTLSYGITLRYTGNVWDVVRNGPLSKQFDPTNPEDPIFTYFLRSEDNAGVGWRISFGELREGVESDAGKYDPNVAKWTYVTPDGGEHVFWQTLHEPQCLTTSTENCDTVTRGVLFSRDGSYLRLTIVSSVATVELPDGQKQRFVLTSKGWRIDSIYTAASQLVNGVPTTNYVKFSYVANANQGEDWKVEDSHGRVHWVRRTASGRVTSVEVDAFAGATATYTFSYSDEKIYKPCFQSFERSQETTKAFLTGLTIPSGEGWAFGYELPHDACSDTSAAMTSATLPTGGQVRWSYSALYTAEVPIATPVIKRSMFDGATEAGRKIYTWFAPGVSTDQTSIETMVSSSGTWRTASKTIQYRVYPWGPESGLPYTKGTGSGAVSNPDASGRYLSSETYTCDPATGNCPASPDKVTYVKYEMDQQIGTGCTLSDPCQIERNRRVVSQRTLYPNDGGRYLDTDYYSYDGHGHYRQVDTGGTFTSGNDRQTYTAYNLSTGSYALDSSGNRKPGFVMIESPAWLLETFGESTQTENGVTAKRQYCFSSSTGLLLRERVLAGAAPGDSDLLSVFTRNATDGSVTREEYFGGDKQGVGTDTDLCETSMPAHDQYSFRIDHAYSYGVRRTSQYMSATGSALPFYSENLTIEKSGLVSSSTDPAGIVTSYLYDVQGRLTSVAPSKSASELGGLARTTYTYTPASSGVLASVRADVDLPGTTSSAESRSVIYEYDAFGRIRNEKTLLPDDTWSIRQTAYDTAGRKASVSEPELSATPVKKTLFSGYDAFGRVGKITLPDGTITTMTYTGDRLTTRTQQVATNTTTETAVSTREETDAAGRLIAVTENAGATSGSETTSYSYDIGNRMSKVTMDAQTRTFTYDLRGLLASEAHPESGLTSYQYDARGHVVESIDANLTKLTTIYDRAERPLRIDENGVVVKAFTYDRPNGTLDWSNGKLATATRHNRSTAMGDLTVTEKYTYGGPAGALSKRLTTMSSGETFSETYAYDDFGNMTALDYPGCGGTCSAVTTPARTVANAFSHGSLTEVPGYTSPDARIAYHPNGMVKTIQHWNSGHAGPLFTQTLADGMSRPASITVSNYCTGLTIDTQPQSPAAPVNSGAPAGLSVQATGATAYQWYRIDGSSDVALAGQTTSTLGTIVTATATFWVRVSNGSCTVDSNRATVTVQECPAPDKTITASSSVTSSATATASVPATAGATYEWSVTGGTITAGAFTRTVTFRAGCSGTLALTVTVTTSCTSSVGSRSVTITPFTATVSGSATIAQGASTSNVKAVLTGVGPWNLTWSDLHAQSASGTVPVTATYTVTPDGTTTYTLNSVSDVYGCPGTRSGSAVVTVTPPAPTAVTALATTANQVGVSWSFSGIKDTFMVFRNGAQVKTTTATSWTDTAVLPDTAYVYRVQAVKSGTASASSAPDVATTVMFTDDPLVPGVTEPKGVHLTELRTAVNAVRAAAGMAPAVVTDTITPAVTLIKAIHVEELGTALNQARTALGLPAIAFAVRPLVNTDVRAADLTEIRGGVK
jgi:YD repeat-containing protein